MSENFDKLNDALDIERTNKLFDSSIGRSNANGEGRYTEDDIKQQRLVIGFGNLHINTAKTKIAIVRLKGYRDSIRGTKQAIERKTRNAQKYGRKTD